jgi:hypothetical protein
MDRMVHRSKNRKVSVMPGKRNLHAGGFDQPGCAGPKLLRPRVAYLETCFPQSDGVATQT